MAKIMIPSALRRYTDKKSSLGVEGHTVFAMLTNLVNTYPDLKPYIFDNNKDFCHFISIYLNDQDIRHLKQQETPVQEADVLTLIPAIAGG